MIEISPKVVHKAGVDITTWHHADSNLDSGEWGCVYVLPSGRILAGGGRETSGKYKGLWYSDDNGETWAAYSVDGLGGCVYSITKQAGVIYALSGADKLWRSVNGGIDWVLEHTMNSSQYAKQVIAPGGFNHTTKLLFFPNSSGKLKYANLNTALGGTLQAGNNSTIFYTVQDSPSANWKDYKFNDIKWLHVAATSDGLYTASDPLGTWTKVYNADCRGIHITSTGRTLISIFNGGIVYTDDFVHFEQSQLTTGVYSRMCSTKNGDILAVDGKLNSNGGGYGKGIQCSEDNGVTWTQIKLTAFNSSNYGNYYADIACTANGRIIVVSNTESDYYPIAYSDEYVTPAVVTREKYLDQNGAQEIVTQFQAYCNSLVGGE